MPVLIFTEHSEDIIKKSSLEAISYGVALAAKLNIEAISLVVGQTKASLQSLGEYGVKKVLHADDATINGVIGGYRCCSHRHHAVDSAQAVAGFFRLQRVFV